MSLSSCGLPQPDIHESKHVKDIISPRQPLIAQSHNHGFLSDSHSVQHVCVYMCQTSPSPPEHVDEIRPVSRYCPVVAYNVLYNSDHAISIWLQQNVLSRNDVHSKLMGEAGWMIENKASRSVYESAPNIVCWTPPSSREKESDGWMLDPASAGSIMFQRIIHSPTVLYNPFELDPCSLLQSAEKRTTSRKKKEKTLCSQSRDDGLWSLKLEDKDTFLLHSQLKASIYFRFYYQLYEFLIQLGFLLKTGSWSGR